jgi:hypothetical protein
VSSVILQPQTLPDHVIFGPDEEEEKQFWANTDHVYVWATIEDWYGAFMFDHPLFGTPKWFKEEIDNDGGDSFVSTALNYEGHIRGIDWMFREGHAPGDRFLFRVFQPQWYRCGWETPEWDCDYNVELVAIERHLKWRARKWQALREFQADLRDRKERQRYYRWLKRWLWRHPGFWQIRVENYHDYDGDGWPYRWRGCYAELLAIFKDKYCQVWHHLLRVDVKDKEGNSTDLVKLRLFDTINAEYAKISREDFEKLPRRI